MWLGERKAKRLLLYNKEPILFLSTPGVKVLCPISYDRRIENAAMLIWEKAEAWNIPVMRTPRNYGKGHQTETFLDDGSAWNKAVGI